MVVDSTFVINLPKEIERKNSIEGEVKSAGIEPYYIDAFDGHDKAFPFYKYKELSGKFWRRQHDFKPGAFACYLSHAECWKKAIDLKKRLTMILEDDASINKSEFMKFAIDSSISNFDVIFINNRATRILENTKDDRKFIPVSDELKRLTLSNDATKKIPAPGGDGYIISLKGALKLLEMMATRKITMGVDYAMLFNSLKLEDIEQLNTRTDITLPKPLDCFIEKELEHLSNGIPPVALESYVYSPNAIVSLNRFRSTIDHTVFLSNDVFNLEA